jgi:hydroxymethylbilane synthase
LSRAQLREFEAEYKLPLQPVLVKTRGDLDQKTSLRDLDRTDFFTREIDEMVLEGRCDLGLHSAKDLPEPLPAGLICALMTRGVDPRDALVFRDQIPVGGTVATSSARRESAVKRWRPDVRVVDIRGNVNERLAQLDAGIIDGLVVAEAALIRLGLTDRPRIYLEGEVAANQGRLAAVIRRDNLPLATLLATL